MVNLRRLVVSVIVAGAFALIILGFNMTKESNPRVNITNAAVKAVVPANGDLDLRQATIGFTLEPAYEGRLEVDGTPIPDDQVRFQIGLNTYSFSPGPGTETGALRPGRHSATAYFWLRGQTEQKDQFVRWEFNVH